MVLRPDVPVHSLRVLAAHVAVRALEAGQVDTLEPVVPVHAAGCVESAGAPGTSEAAPVQGRFQPGVPHHAVVLLQNDRSEVCKHKHRPNGRALERRCATERLSNIGMIREERRRGREPAGTGRCLLPDSHRGSLRSCLKTTV